MKSTTKRPSGKQQSAPPPSKRSEVATRPARNQALASTALFEQHAGAGLENVTARDLIIPRLTILQALSPQLDRQDALYDKKANVGDIYDVGLQETFGQDGIIFLPVHFSKVWLEWAPRKSGEGLIRIHDTDDVLIECEHDEKGRSYHGDNLVVETAQFYGLNLSAEGRRSFIPFASTQMKKAKRLITLATSERVSKADGSEFTPPFFYRTYKLGVVPESNNEGKWIGWTIERDMKVEELDGWEDLFSEAVAFRDQLVAGEARGDLSSLRRAETSSSDAGGDDSRM